MDGSPGPADRSAPDGAGGAAPRPATGGTAMRTGASIDTMEVEAPPARPRDDEADDAEDTDLADALPNAERLVAQAVALAGDDVDAALVDRYWRFAPDEELVGCTPDGLLTAALRHRELAEQRVPGELKLRISEPRDEQQHTVIEIVTDDMPFLVDSATAALVARDLDVHLLVHPILVVHREPLGKLLDVCADVEPDDALDGDELESWMRIETDAIRDKETRLIERLRAQFRPRRPRPALPQGPSPS